MSHAALLLLAGTLAGCTYDLNPPRPESEPSTDSRRIDRPPSLPEAPVPSPPVEWRNAPADCAAGSKNLMSGGGACGGPGLRALFAQGPRFEALCADESKATAWAGCAVFPTSIGESIASGTLATAGCSKGTLVGGGCSCGTAIRVAGPQPVGNKWQCACAVGEATAVSICTSAALFTTIIRAATDRCDPIELLLAGGCGCPSGYVSLSTPDRTGPAAVWLCACHDGSKPQIDVLCARQ